MASPVRALSQILFFVILGISYAAHSGIPIPNGGYYTTQGYRPAGRYPTYGGPGPLGTTFSANTPEEVAAWLCEQPIKYGLPYQFVELQISPSPNILPSPIGTYSYRYDAYATMCYYKAPGTDVLDWTSAWIGVYCNGSGVPPNCGSNPSRLQITAAVPPIIPTDSRVQNRRILTSSKLALKATQNSQPRSAVPITLESSRPAADQIEAASVITDAGGNANSILFTREQPGSSTVSAASPQIQSPVSTAINWLPARYESDFLITCYTISTEAEFLNTPEVNNVCGLPPENNYRRGFLNDTRMQGSGRTTNGTIIHYDGRGCYSAQNCALTATGACAAVGVTVAVDPRVIPRRSTINIDILGQRVAQDTGGWINNYHIDEYVGPVPRAQCLALGRRNSGVSFINY